jgi:hypothetical protein
VRFGGQSRFSTLRRPRPEPDKPAIFKPNGEPLEVENQRGRWSWWHPIGWVVETKYADGSSGRYWAARQTRAMKRQLGGHDQ